jgi:hypothetical protein
MSVTRLAFLDRHLTVDLKSDKMAVALPVALPAALPVPNESESPNVSTQELPRA